MTFDNRTITALSLAGTTLDALGGLYLTYDLLGSRYGPVPPQNSIHAENTGGSRRACACQKLRKRGKLQSFEIHRCDVADTGSSKGPARHPGKVGQSLVNRADLSLLETWFALRQPSVGTCSPRPSGYAKPSRFAKEFAPYQVLSGLRNEGRGTSGQKIDRVRPDRRSVR